MSQKTHHQLVECPTYTGNILIFPWLQVSKRFNRDFYIPLMTGYKISFEHIDLFLNEADMIASKRNSKIRSIYSIYFTLIAIITMGVLTALFELDKPKIFKIGIFLIWLFMTMIAGIQVSNCAHRRIDRAMAEIDAVKKNFSPYFEEQGFEWKYVRNYPGWMELSKITKVHGLEGEEAPKSATFVLDQDRQIGFEE